VISNGIYPESGERIGPKNAMRIVKLDHSNKIAGLTLRRHREGPETDLVEWFLTESHIKVQRGHQITIFREPQLASGFPDLVIVVWKPSATSAWSPYRARLTNADIRLMSYLAQVGPCSLEAINDVFGHRLASRSLAHLSEARMVKSSRTYWTARALGSIFATKHIVAIEAKINKWKEALNQAILNKWFASSSCILMPKVPTTTPLIERANLFDIGVRVSEQKELDISTKPLAQIPMSHASWLFNEWAWRAELSAKERVDNEDEHRRCLASSAI